MTRTPDSTQDTAPDTTTDSPGALPRWTIADVHESLTARSFVDAMERSAADVERLQALFDEHGVRDCAGTRVGGAHGPVADAVLTAFNEASDRLEILEACVYATVSTNSRDEAAQALLTEIEVMMARVRPLLSRLAEWVAALGPEALATVSPVADDHLGPLRRLADRAAHQMSEAEEGLYAELSVSGSNAWGRLQADVTSQLSTEVERPDGTVVLPMPAVRGLASDPDPRVRRAAYDAEQRAWPQVSVACAAAMNGVKGEAVTVNKRRGWTSPLDASLFANSVSRQTFDAMQQAVVDSLPDFRRWMRVKAKLQGHSDALPWWDLLAPLPMIDSQISWETGLDIVRGAFSSYGGSLAGLVDRALQESWIDAEPRDGKVGGAFCMPFVSDRSLVLLNWSGSADSTQTTAHELGHAYHNTQLAHRTALQKRLPMALAETASIFCETLVVDEGLSRMDGLDRLALLDVDLQNATQVVVDIHSRFLFETEVFARRARRTLGVRELDDLMLEAQQSAYGDGLDQSTAHRHMWVLKPHYYGSHFYNWPYTFGLLFGLGLFARYRTDAERFRSGYDDLLSRAGMDTAEELGAAFDLDISDVSFWTASLDVLRSRIDDYERLATELT